MNGVVRSGTESTIHHLSGLAHQARELIEDLPVPGVKRRRHPRALLGYGLLAIGALAAALCSLRRKRQHGSQRATSNGAVANQHLPADMTIADLSSNAVADLSSNAVADLSSNAVAAEVD